MPKCLILAVNTRMATTVIWTPLLCPSDDDVLRQFDQNTRFCFIPDHYHTPPTGFLDQKKLVTEKYCLAERLMQERKDVIFLTTYWHERLNQYPNVHYYNGWLVHSAKRLRARQPFDSSKDPDSVTAMIMGGKRRVNRVLASHWLAKNYPLEQLKVHGRQTDSLEDIKNIISASPYYKKHHIKKNRYLKDYWPARNTIGDSETDVFINHLLPNLLSKSFLAFMPDTINLELGNYITEKTLYAMAGKSLILWLGQYQAGDLLKRMGFETFENVFNIDHFDITDRYGSTIMGFENNKDIIMSHEQIKHIWHENQKTIQHNYEIACVNDHIDNFFKQSKSMVQEAIRFVDSTIDKNYLEDITNHEIAIS